MHVRAKRRHVLNLDKKYSLRLTRGPNLRQLEW
jgi:hypothetical protein